MRSGIGNGTRSSLPRMPRSRGTGPALRSGRGSKRRASGVTRSGRATAGPEVNELDTALCSKPVSSTILLRRRGRRGLQQKVNISAGR
eukprot:1532930-Heterocapsa_arctica.AAC.1